MIFKFCSNGEHCRVSRNSACLEKRKFGSYSHSCRVLFSFGLSFCRLISRYCRLGSKEQVVKPICSTHPHRFTLLLVHNIQFSVKYILDVEDVFFIVS